MSKRNVVLANEEFYHVFNRSVGRESMFSSKIMLRKILEITNYYRYVHPLRLSKFKTLEKERKRDYMAVIEKQSPLVEIYAYTFMPNHYHFLLKQKQTNGIKLFISNVQNSFAKMYNLKTDRHGTLFQNPFKAKLVETDEEFIHISRYIHLNAVTAYLLEFRDLLSSPFSSFQCYASPSATHEFVSKDEILRFFKTHNEYIQFVSDQISYQRELKNIKHLIIE